MQFSGKNDRIIGRLVPPSLFGWRRRLGNPGAATVDNIKTKVFYCIRTCMTGLPGDGTVGAGEEGVPHMIMIK